MARQQSKTDFMDEYYNILTEIDKLRKQNLLLTMEFKEAAASAQSSSISRMVPDLG